MGRIARSELLYNGCYAHVFSRSLTKIRIFQDRFDFDNFLNLLAKVKRKRNFRIYHYCLMNTHFHMVIEVGKVEDFSNALKELKRTYTYSFNGRFKRVGPLWRDRFKSLLIEDENYLSACGVYVEMNPVKAGMVKACEEWEFSSSRHYILGKKDGLIDEYEREEIPTNIDTDDDSIFTKGCGVGSKLFNILLRQQVGGG